MSWVITRRSFRIRPTQRSAPYPKKRHQGQATKEFYKNLTLFVSKTVFTLRNCKRTTQIGWSDKLSISFGIRGSTRLWWATLMRNMNGCLLNLSLNLTWKKWVTNRSSFCSHMRSSITGSHDQPRRNLDLTVLHLMYSLSQVWRKADKRIYCVVVWLRK